MIQTLSPAIFPTLKAIFLCFISRHALVVPKSDVFRFCSSCALVSACAGVRRVASLCAYDFIVNFILISCCAGQFYQSATKVGFDGLTCGYKTATISYPYNREDSFQFRRVGVRRQRAQGVGVSPANPNVQRRCISQTKDSQHKMDRRWQPPS